MLIHQELMVQSKESLDALATSDLGGSKCRKWQEVHNRVGSPLYLSINPRFGIANDDNQGTESMMFHKQRK